MTYFPLINSFADVTRACGYYCLHSPTDSSTRKERKTTMDHFSDESECDEMPDLTSANSVVQPYQYEPLKKPENGEDAEDENTDSSGESVEDALDEMSLEMDQSSQEDNPADDVSLW